MRIADIRDGVSNTAMLVEVNDDRAVTWTKPDDFDWKADDPAAGLGSMHPGDIFVVAFCDGHTVVIPKSSATKENLTAIFTKAGGEAVDHAALGP